MTTKDVLDRHLAAFQAGDVDATMDAYADSSVMIGQRGVSRGRAEIRASFERVYTGVLVPGQYEFVVDHEEIEGEVAYIAWHASTATLDIVLGTDTFVIRDGLILAQTVALHVQPK